MNTKLKPIYAEPRYETKHAYCTTSKSEEILGYTDKTPLKEGLANMISWAKKIGPIDPIIWEGYEQTRNLPAFWKNLKEDFPNAKNRINIKEF